MQLWRRVNLNTDDRTVILYSKAVFLHQAEEPQLLRQ